MHCLQGFRLSPDIVPEATLADLEKHLNDTMTRRRIRVASCLTLAIALASAVAALWTPAQQPIGAGTSNAPVAQPMPSTEPRKPTLAEFAWLAGRWQGSWGPRFAQETWTAPKAGVMLGTFQLAEGDRTLVLELFTLVEGPNGIEFHLRHFTPALIAWEKPGPTVLNLTGMDAKTATFENPIDGQPKHAIFTRTDADTFVSRSEIIPEKGETQVTEITYHRQFDGPPPKQHKEKKSKPSQ